jgi:predicted nucleotidyltransferase
MATQALELLFGTKARIGLLRRLAQETVPLTARQLADLTGLTHRSVVAALQPLVDSRIVKLRKIGGAYQYLLEKEHVLVQEVLLPVLEGEVAASRALEQSLVEMLAERAVSIILFGSMARGDEAAGSDVDCLVVVRSAPDCASVTEMVESRRADFFRRFGRSLSIHCLTKRELAESPPAFVLSALGESRTLFGRELSHLVVSRG